MKAHVSSQRSRTTSSKAHDQGGCVQLGRWCAPRWRPGRACAAAALAQHRRRSRQTPPAASSPAGSALSAPASAAAAHTCRGQQRVCFILCSNSGSIRLPECQPAHARRGGTVGLHSNVSILCIHWSPATFDTMPQCTAAAMAHRRAAGSAPGATSCDASGSTMEYWKTSCRTGAAPSRLLRPDAFAYSRSNANESLGSCRGNSEEKSTSLSLKALHAGRAPRPPGC